MPEKWTGDVVALMHVNQISNGELAKHLNVSPAYVSMVLNGHKKPAGAEARFRAALNELIASKGGTERCQGKKKDTGNNMGR